MRVKAKELAGGGTNLGFWMVSGRVAEVSGSAEVLEGVVILEEAED